MNRTVLTALLPVALASLAVPASAQTEPVFPCLNPPAIVSAVPADSPIADQNSLNCFAWQEFIALNWTAKAVNLPAGVDAKAYFGRPGDYTPTVWETYSDIHDVFQPDGVPPPSFGQLPETPTTCYGGNGSRRRVLTRTSKFSVEVDIPEDIAEAFPFDGSPNWLADKDGNQVYYEIMINKDEYDYIVQNELYNALTGYLLSAGGQHVDLPRGLLGGGQTGSIELKAAWIAVPDPSAPQWATYKQSVALIHDPVSGSCEESVVALAGLHILHKTTSQPQWVWATFEHTQNAPDQSAVTAGSVEDVYRFFNPSCTPQPIPAQCVGNKVGTCDSTKKSDPPLTMTSCSPNDSPAYCISSACPALPVQVTREHAIANGQDNLVADVNAAAQAAIRRAAGEDSVFANYMLVDVLWSDSPVDENTANRPPSATPLSISGMRPAPTERPVANTLMETYIQNTTCILCHQHAAIVQPQGQGKTTSYASDYSFSFSNAKAPATER